jgi:hypothetical protein
VTRHSLVSQLIFLWMRAVADLSDHFSLLWQNGSSAFKHLPICRAWSQARRITTFLASTPRY